MSSAFFHPSPDRAMQVMSDLSNPDLSFAAVAARHSTTIAALSLWISKSESAADLAGIHSGFCDRTRLLAAAVSSTAIASLTRILDRFIAADRAPDPALTTLERLRARELAYRASAALLRLMTFRPAPLGSHRAAASAVSPAPSQPQQPPARPHPTRAAAQTPSEHTTLTPASLAAPSESLASTATTAAAAIVAAAATPASNANAVPIPSASPHFDCAISNSVLAPFSPPPTLPPRPRATACNFRQPSRSPASLLAAAGHEHWP